MMAKKTILFDQINPFVRHVHLQRIEPDFHLASVKAYDCRFIYIYDGKGHIVVNNVKCNVLKGNLLLWLPGTEYLIYSDPIDNLIIIGVNFDFTHDKSDNNCPIPPERSRSFDEALITEYVNFADMEAFNKPIFLSNLQVLESTLLEMKNEYMSRKKYYTHKINGLFHSLLGDVARYTCTSRMYPDAGLDLIDLILKYIHDNYNKPVNNREIGARFNFHANYISKLMVQYTGTPLHQYLINCRISKAIHLMQTTNKSISEIAFQVGFRDVNYFSKAFKNKTNECPRNFKAHSWGPI